MIKPVDTGDIWNVSIWLPFLTSVAWLVTVVASSHNSGFTLSEAPLILQKIVSNIAILALFQMTIMSLALIEKRGTLGKRLSFVGDLSYSSYLLHFPFQLVIGIVTVKLSIGQEWFYSPWFMALFFLVLVLVSLVSHRYFEVPMQTYLRPRS